MPPHWLSPTGNQRTREPAGVVYTGESLRAEPREEGRVWANGRNSVEEKRPLFYPLRFRVGGPANETEKRQVSRRKDI